MPAVQAGLEVAVDHVVEQRALAGAAHARDRGQGAERDVGVHALEVVQGGAANPEPARSRRAARAGHGDALLAGEVLAGERGARRLDRAGVHHTAAAIARAGSELEHEIGLPDGGQVVLDDDDRVAGVAEAAQQREQAVGVARVEADGRLVEHVQRVHQPRAEGVGERDALGLAAGQGAGLAVEREIAEADVAEKAEPGVELRDDEVGDLALPGRELERGEPRGGSRPPTGTTRRRSRPARFARRARRD